MVVLDTQAWLWWTHDPKRLSQVAREAVQQAESTNGILVSAISAWEIAVKSALGKLELAMDIDAWYGQARTYPNLVVEPLSARIAIDSTRLPGSFHKDPADRIIVALARHHGVSLVTTDKLIRAYPHVSTVW
jgi:PIN domain nuclease of toxin-antitoxin system